MRMILLTMMLKKETRFGILLNFSLVLGSLAVAINNPNAAGKGKNKDDGDDDDDGGPGNCKDGSFLIGSLDETSFPQYVPLTGVYHLLEDVKYGRKPVYKHATIDAYLYFQKAKGSPGPGHWVVESELGGGNPVLALTSNLKSAAQKWQVLNPTNGSWTDLGNFKAVCVSKDFSACTSGRLRLSGVSARHALQDRRMGVYVLTNRTHNLRPVYKHQGVDEFLFYMRVAGGEWLVGPEVGRSRGGLFVKDHALRPEFIRESWIVFAGKYFAEDRGVALRCNGVEIHASDENGGEHVGPVLSNGGSEGDVGHGPMVEVGRRVNGEKQEEVDGGHFDGVGIARYLQLREKGNKKHEGKGEEGCDLECANGGVCKKDDGVTFRCLCPPSYFGVTCQLEIDCGEPPAIDALQQVSTTGRFALDVVFYGCTENTVIDGQPGVVCQVDGTWTSPPRCVDGPHLITPQDDMDEAGLYPINPRSSMWSRGNT